jgi:hypothetical protein
VALRSGREGRLRSRPYGVEHAHEHLDEPDPDEPTEFELGLDPILDGLDRMRGGA